MAQRHIGAICCICVGIGSAVCAQTIEDATVLEKLKNFDSTFQSGFTVSGTLNGKDVVRYRPRWRLPVKRRWKLTFDGDRVAYLTDVIEYEKPAYQEKLKTKDGPDAEMAINVRTKEWGYWGPDFLGLHYEDTNVTVTPEGQVAEHGKAPASCFFGTRDAGPTPRKQITLWALGRFFSRHLDKVTRVEKSADGRLLSVTALGKMSDGDAGRWELEIESGAAWMVRHARFFWDKHPKQVSAEMRNAGTVWSGSHCIPKEAVCNYFGSIEGDDAKRLMFDPVVGPFDEGLYRQARQEIMDNKEPALLVHDYRVSPPLTTEPNRPKSSRIPPMSAPALSARNWFLMVNLALIALVLAALVCHHLWQRRRRNTETSGK